MGESAGQGHKRIAQNKLSTVTWYLKQPYEVRFMIKDTQNIKKEHIIGSLLIATWPSMFRSFELSKSVASCDLSYDTKPAAGKDGNDDDNKIYCCKAIIPVSYPKMLHGKGCAIMATSTPRKAPASIKSCLPTPPSSAGVPRTVNCNKKWPAFIRFNDLESSDQILKYLWLLL